MSTKTARVEWMVHFWGANKDKVKIPEGAEVIYHEGSPYVYFQSEAESEQFINHLRELIDKYHGIVWNLRQGALTHKRTLAKVTLSHKGQTYILVYDFGYEYPADSAEYMFEDGNYSCDCNRSSFIRSYCDESFPEMECGHTIDLVELKLYLSE